MKNSHSLKQISQTNKTILEQLIDKYADGSLGMIEDKPYVVYDIETTFTGNRIQDQHFEMAYSIDSGEDNSEKLQYRYIDDLNAQRYCDYLLDYNGWII